MFWATIARMAAKDALGKRGESLAAAHLENLGYTVIDRNWRCSQGEIDLVVRERDEVAFVEVKTRSTTAFGHPLESITAPKLARLKRLANAWLDAHALGVPVIRIDAVAVIAPRGGPVSVEHLKRVF